MFPRVAILTILLWRLIGFPFWRAYLTAVALELLMLACVGASLSVASVLAVAL